MLRRPGKYTKALHPHDRKGKFAETLDAPSWLGRVGTQLIDRATGGGKATERQHADTIRAAQRVRGSRASAAKAGQDARVKSATRERMQGESARTARLLGRGVGGKVDQQAYARQLRSLDDDKLYDQFAEISRQKKLDERDEAALVALSDEMGRREKRSHRAIPAAQAKRDGQIDALVAKGHSFRDAYAEVEGVDPAELDRQERASTLDAQRGKGETREQAMRRLYQEQVHLQYLAAEQATNGHMLNAQGKAQKDLPAVSLFSGTSARANKYASEELRDYWREHPRVTFAEFKAATLGRPSDKQAADKAKARARDAELAQPGDKGQPRKKAAAKKTSAKTAPSLVGRKLGGSELTYLRPGDEVEIPMGRGKPPVRATVLRIDSGGSMHTVDGRRVTRDGYDVKVVSQVDRHNVTATAAPAEAKATPGTPTKASNGKAGKVDRAAVVAKVRAATSQDEVGRILRKQNLDIGELRAIAAEVAPTADKSDPDPDHLVDNIAAGSPAGLRNRPASVFAGDWHRATPTATATPSTPAPISAAEAERRRQVLAQKLSDPTASRPEHGMGMFSTDPEIRKRTAAALDRASARSDALRAAAAKPAARASARAAFQQVVERRPYAGAAAEVAELQAKGADDKTMAEHVRLWASPGHPDMQEAERGDNGKRIRADLEVVAQHFDRGDRAGGIKAMDAVMREHGLIARGGGAGATVKFDPAVHRSVGEAPAAGAKVHVIRPGVAFQRGDGDVVPMSEAQVTTALPPAKAVTAKPVAAPRSKVDPAKVSADVRSAATEDDVSRILTDSKLTVPQLRTLAGEIGPHISTKGSKAQLVNNIAAGSPAGLNRPAKNLAGTWNQGTPSAPAAPSVAAPIDAAEMERRRQVLAPPLAQNHGLRAEDGAGAFSTDAAIRGRAVSALNSDDTSRSASGGRSPQSPATRVEPRKATASTKKTAPAKATSPSLLELGSSIKVGDQQYLSQADPRFAETVHGIFDGTFGPGLTVEINDSMSSAYRATSEDGLVISAEGLIKNPDGKVVGSFRRMLYPETGKVHNDTLAIAGEYQHKGFASAFTAQAEQHLAKAGFKKLTVSPTAAGGVAWADFGWNHDKVAPAGDVPSRIGYLENERDTPPADRAMMNGWLDRFRSGDKASWPTPREIADSPYGERIMKGASWQGVRDVRGSSAPASKPAAPSAKPSPPQEPSAAKNRPNAPAVRKTPSGPTPKGSAAGNAGEPAIEVAASGRDLSNADIAAGRNLTPAGRAALDALGPAGHPAVAAQTDAEAKVKTAYQMLKRPGERNSYVALADLRKLIGDQAPRAEVDEALKDLAKQPGNNLVPQSYARGVHVDERQAASVRFGGQDQDLLTISGPFAGRDLTADSTTARTTADSAIDYAALHVYPSTGGSSIGPHGDELAAGVARAQGFDGPPTVVTRAEMDQLIADGHVEMHRGVHGNGELTAADIQERLRSGDAYYSTEAVYGSGIYVAPASRAKAEYYADGSPGSVARMSLSKDAKVITYRDLMVEQTVYLRAFDGPEPEYRVLNDLGRYGSARGYDAILMPGPPAEYVVFNRTALIVEEAE